MKRVRRRPNVSDCSFKRAFDEDEEIQKYGSNALLLFTLGLYLRAEDIKELAAEGLTAGSDDKKADFCYLDLGEGRAIVAQAYCGREWGRDSAPANKASDLNTAMAWLVSTNLKRLPEQLKPKAQELRRALTEGDIKRVEIVYVHNCLESTNVSDELKSVAEATQAKIEALGAEDVVVSCREYGIQGIEDLYKTRDAEILVDEWVKIPGTCLGEESCNGWKAVVVTVSGGWLQALFQKHGDRLFSANFRDYMGVTERKGNINNGIKHTTSSEPLNFWVFNNGVTALTHKIRVAHGRLSVKGISIINGAQTTGALGESKRKHARKTRVLFRVVQCGNKELIKKIIRFNNTQNVIRPADQRSKDEIQKRLHTEFERYKIPYVHRRSAARGLRNPISAAAIGPLLCAFHGDSQTASRNSAEIFQSDVIYQKVFRQDISAEHVYLVQSLASALDDLKYGLKGKIAAETATALETQQYEVLKYSMSKHFIMYLMGEVAEELLESRVSDPFGWKCKPNLIDPRNSLMKDAWSAALQALLPQVATLVSRQGQAYDVVRSTNASKKVAEDLKALLASLMRSIGPQFGALRKRTAW
jgi:hypothetical protein